MDYVTAWIDALQDGHVGYWAATVGAALFLIHPTLFLHMLREAIEYIVPATGAVIAFGFRWVRYQLERGQHIIKKAALIGVLSVPVILVLKHVTGVNWEEVGQKILDWMGWVTANLVIVSGLGLTWIAVIFFSRVSLQEWADFLRAKRSNPPEEDITTPYTGMGVGDVADDFTEVYKDWKKRGSVVIDDLRAYAAKIGKNGEPDADVMQQYAFDVIEQEQQRLDAVRRMRNRAATATAPVPSEFTKCASCGGYYVGDTCGSAGCS